MKASLYPFKGLTLIFSKGFRRYAAMPIAINVTLFVGLYALSLRWFWQMANSFEVQLPGWLSWLSVLGPFLFWLVFIGLAVALLFALGQIASLLTSIIASPFNSLLAEKILKSHGVINQEVPLAVVFREAIVRELSKIIYLLPRLIAMYCLFGLLYFVPVLNLVGTVLLFIFSSWLLSFEYFDFSAEAQAYKMSDYKQWLKQNRAQTHPFGWSCMGLSLIPILNLVCVPACVAGAALLWIKQSGNQD